MDQETDTRLGFRDCQRELEWGGISSDLGSKSKKVVDKGILCEYLRCLNTWLSRSANWASVYMTDDFRRLLSRGSGWVCATHFSKSPLAFCSFHLQLR